MSKRLLRKMMAVLVCVALLLGIIPVAWAGGDAYAAAQEVSLTNSGFEAAQPIPGWDRIYGDGTDFSISNLVFYSGNSSLKVDDKVSDGGKWMYGSKFAVIAGDELSASAWVNVEKGAAEFCLKFFDDAGSDVGGYPDTTVIPGDWSQQSVTGTVPAGATQAAVFIYSGMGAITTAYFDDVTVSINDVAATLTNPGFEDVQTIPGWNRIYGDGTNFSVSNTILHTGAASLMVKDDVTDGGKWMYGDQFDVISGDVLSATAWVKVEKGFAEFCIQYFDDADNVVPGYPDTTVATGDWSQQNVSGTVPEGATKAAVFIYSGMSAVTTAYFDDVQVTREAALPPVDPNAVSLTNSGFEELKPVPGWYVLDGSGSVSLSKTVVNGGLNSLEMIDTGATQSPMVCSEIIPVVAGDKIIASTYANVSKNSGTAAYVDAIFSVWYVDADGSLLGQAYGPDNTGNTGWTQYTSNELTIPAQSNSKDVKGIVVAFYGAGGGECKAYYDDVAVSKNGTAYELYNSNFEAVPGWTIIDGSGSLTVSSAAAYSGTNSLEMIDTGATQSPMICSEIVPVNPGDTISASIYANVASNGGTAYVDAIFSIWYVDANGYLLGQAYGPDIQTNGGWNKYTSPEIVVPAQAAGSDVAGICIGLYGAGGGECKAYFDDAQVIVKATGLASDSKNIMNADFEATIPADGSIPYWQMDDGATSANYMITNSVTYNSSNSLKMVDPGAGSSPWLYSNIIDVKPGDKITLNAHVKVETGGYAELSVLYLDSNGDWIFPYANMEIGTCDWSEKTLTGTVPNGAVAVRAFIWSGNAAATTAYFDDVTLKVGAELLPKTAFSTDCSNLLSLKDAGWFIDEPYIGNYTTDNTHSTGDSNGTVTLKDVPAGQMLFFMDRTTEEESVGAFKKVDNANIIGNSPWKLELDMNLQDLMTAAAPNVNSGFSIIIDIGEADKVYRVNFGGDGKIRALTNSGFSEKSADLHIGDGQIHHWMLEGDSTGSLVIKCDGTTAATFTGVHAAGSWGEAGIHFIAYNSGISAGNNEIYFDNIKLTTYTENPGAGARFGAPVDLGAAVMGGQPLFLYSIIEKNPVTNLDELYTVTTGSQDNSSIFYAINPSTGEMLFSEQITGTVHNYGIVKGSDGNIYFAGCDTGKLYRYIPGAAGQGKVEYLGTNPCDTWVWDIAASDDGKIYGATSQTDGGSEGAKVFEYDIATATFKDLGIVKAGATYARGLGVDGDYLYVGVGMPDALIQINRADTTQKTEISIPALGTIPGTGTDGRMCGHVWSYNGKLFVRNNAMKLFVLDATTHELLNVLSFQQAIASPSPYDSDIIYYKSKNAVWQYECSTNTASQVPDSPVLSGDASNSLDWFTQASGTKDGRQLLAITDDAGGMVVYDPQDNTAVDVKLVMLPQAVDIQSIEKGPDGNIYIGGYQFGASIFDPESQTFINNAPRLDQPEGIGFLNGKVYFGTYGSARIYSYDPTKPFNYTYEAGGNPGLVYDIGNDQDRPFALTSGDNKLFVGTIPDYGALGGALTVYDEQAGTWTEYRNIIENQSITGLAYKDGKIYGGTSIAGGLGIDSAADQAKVFVWDVASGTLEKEATIDLPGLSSTYEQTERTTPVMIGSLSFGEDGLLWGAVDGALVALNPDTLEVVKYKVLTSMDYDHDSAWRPYYLRWGADGLLYTTIGRRVSVFNTETMGYDVLIGYAGLATLGNDGNIYYASGSRLMMAPNLTVMIKAANEAIEAIPGTYDITLEDRASVAAARTAVKAALAAGAAESEIVNLSKLVICEGVIAQLSSGGGVTPTPTPTPTPNPEEPVFNDVNGNWAHKAIMTLAKAGILSGYSDGTVKPNANATRAEFVNMVIKMMKVEAKNSADFNDIASSAWYMKAISAAVEKGWIKGRTDGSFGPNDSISREEAMVIISKVIDSLGESTTVDESVLAKYQDSSKIASWAKADVAKLVGLGIIQGSGNLLNPKSEITRAEISTILVRVLEGYINK